MRLPEIRVPHGRLAAFSALVLTGAFTIPTAQAQNRRTVHIEEARVALQPFALDTPAPMIRGPVQLAYYAPRAVPRAAAVEDDDEAAKVPQFETGGSRPVVAGSRAVLKNGIAYAPANAPAAIKSAIWAVNSLRGKPYKWGGGHGSFDDTGYDCSGSVSFALHYAGVLDSPMPSSEFTQFGERGQGRWITIYSRRGHTFAVIAGLRLDTSDLQRGGDVGPRWHVEGRDIGAFAARHPAGL